MYCKYCGSEISENATFCSSCGKSQEECGVPEQIAKKGNAINEVIDLVKSFFSRTPMSAMEKTKEKSVGAGLIITLTNVLLFGFVTCNTVVQLLNHIVTGFINSLGSALTLSLVDLTSLVESELSMSVNYDLWLPLSAIMLVVLGLEAVLIYVLQVIKKKECRDWKIIVNLISVASLPVLAGLVVSFIVGLIYPPLVIGVCIAMIVIHMIFVYHVFKQLGYATNESVICFTLFALVLCLVITLLGCDVLGAIMEKLYDILAENVGNTTGDMFESFF